MSRSAYLVLALAAFSCAPEADGPATDTSRETVAVDLQIGTMDGPDPYVFTRISGLLADPEGRIIVADYQSNEIRVFDPDGLFLYGLGRGGSGPGELDGPCCLAWSPEGLLLVRDGGNHRYSSYQLLADSGHFVDQMQFAHGDANFLTATTFDAQGRLVDAGHRTSPDGGLDMVRFHLGHDGGVEEEDVIPGATPREVGQHAVQSGSSTLFVYQPFGPRQLVAHGPAGRWAEVLTSSYEVHVHPEGSVLRRQIQGPALSPAEIERGREDMKRSADLTGSSVAALPFDLPARKTPVRSLFFDTDGRIWVERHTPEGLAKIADVWSEEGVLEAEVEWPNDVNLRYPSWVGSDYILGVRSDTLGVNYVVRLRYR